MKRKQETNNIPASKKQKTEVTISNLSSSTILSILEFLTLEEVLLKFVLVCKKFKELGYQSITSVTYADVPFDHIEKLISNLHLYPNLNKVSFDGLDVLNDENLSKLMKKLPPKLEQVHIRECNLIKPNIEGNQIKILKISLCNMIDLLTINSSTLEQLEFYECDIVNPPILKCINLKKISFYRCKGISDKFIQHLLLQFNHTKENNPLNNSLESLTIIESEPLNSPIIACDTLKDLRLINCVQLTKPMIVECNKLENIQLCWCEKVENLILGCDNLKSIDLQGTGINLTNQNETIRKSIIQAIKNHYGDRVTISY